MKSSIDLPYSFGVSDKRIVTRHNGHSDPKAPHSLSNLSSNNATFYNKKVNSKVDTSLHSLREKSSSNKPRKKASDQNIKINDIIRMNSLSKSKTSKKNDDEYKVQMKSMKSVNTRSSK